MDSATIAVINYLEQRAEVDRVLAKDKPKCSIDALICWQEVEKKYLQINHSLFVYFFFDQKNTCELPEDLQKFYTMSDGLEIRWSCKTGNNSRHSFFFLSFNSN